MDELASRIMDEIKREAIDLGSDLIRDGVNLLREHLEGQASDEAIMTWLRRSQEES